MMLTFQDYWPRIKQAFLPIVYFCVVQIWWSFHFTPFAWLGAFWSPFLVMVMNVLLLSLCIFLFLFPEMYLPSKPVKSPAITSIMQYVGLSGAILLAWYVDLYGMASGYYVLMYFHAIVVCVLFDRSIEQYNMRCKSASK